VIHIGPSPAAGLAACLTAAGRPAGARPVLRCWLWGHPRMSVLSFAVALFRAEANSDKPNRGLLTPTALHVRGHGHPRT
jgi:hypothetical protein